MLLCLLPRFLRLALLRLDPTLLYLLLLRLSPSLPLPLPLLPRDLPRALLIIERTLTSMTLVDRSHSFRNHRPSPNPVVELLSIRNLVHVPESRIETRRMAEYPVLGRRTPKKSVELIVAEERIIALDVPVQVPHKVRDVLLETEHDRSAVDANGLDEVLAEREAAHRFAAQ